MMGDAVFRNSRLFLAAILLPGIVFGFCCLCGLVLTLSATGKLLPISADSIYSVVAWAFTTLSCGLMSLWLFQQGRRMAYNHALLKAAGIEFHYGPKRSPREFFLPWAAINCIQTWRLPHGQAYRVETSPENFVEFSSYTFFRPKKLATLIAERTNCSIERIKK